MPMRMFTEEPETGRPVLTAQPSIAMEIDWAVAAAQRVDPRTQPALYDFYNQNPDIAEHARHLWGPKETLTYPGYLELSAVAYGGGLLFNTDSDLFLSRLEEMCLSAPEGLAFSAETPHDKARLLRRLHLLRTDAGVRRRYVEIVTELWSGDRSVWESEGRRA